MRSAPCSNEVPNEPQAEGFSWYPTTPMHRFTEDCPFAHRTQIAALDYVASSKAMQTAITENYVGLPL